MFTEDPALQTATIWSELDAPAVDPLLLRTKEVDSDNVSSAERDMSLKKMCESAKLSPAGLQYSVTVAVAAE